MARVKGLFFVALGGILPILALSQTEQLAPVPGNPLELATGPIQTVDTPEGRAALIDLLNRARRNYQLRHGANGYVLKASFTANSGGQIPYDGNWQIEEMFLPKVGDRLTASTAGFSTTRIRSQNVFYADADAPLVLHEAHGALFGPMPSYANAERDLIRTASGNLDGVQLTCVLLSHPSDSNIPPAGRSWLENEECIDPQTGLLRVHSLVPGRYALYDYTDSLQFHGHVLPRTITITEAGNPLLEVTVTSVQDLAEADPNLFIATEQMKARGQGTEDAGAIKLPLLPSRVSSSGNPTIQPIVLFGLLKPSGEMEDLHSLQPSDPNSQIAVESSKAIHFHIPTASGAAPEQHFIFIIKRSFPEGGAN